MNHLLGPLEGSCVRVVAATICVDRLPHLRGRREAGALERPAAQNTKSPYILSPMHGVVKEIPLKLNEAMVENQLLMVLGEIPWSGPKRKAAASKNTKKSG